MGRHLSLHGFLHGLKLLPEDEHNENLITHSSALPDGSALFRSIAYRSVAIPWLNDCITHHAKCREVQSHEKWLPTRLIDVGVDLGSQEPRLVITSELSARKASYVTLSHRWASTNVVKLKSSDLDSFRKRIPVESLSSTFQDAIRVTRTFGIRYLWIDSLCIIQNSLADWQAESVEMGRVYRNSILNIAATGDSDNGGGIFQKRSEHWVSPPKIRIYYEGHHQTYFVTLYDIWGKWISRSTLNRSGWVFQERMLSPRTLHFASQLFWECRTLQACETYPRGMSDSEYTELDGFELPISLKNWYEDCTTTAFWTRVVESYGRCSITKPEDRLIAIAGIAKSLQPILEDNYLAGLWKKDLPYNLVWYFNVEGEQRLPEKYRRPSWSWAALDYTSAAIECLLVHAVDRIKTLVSVPEDCVFIEPLGCDVFGPLLGGHIRLMGRIGRVFHLSDECPEAEWISDHYSFEVMLDLGLDDLDNNSLYCLPLCVGTHCSPFEYVECLLLRQIEQGVYNFTRVGVLRVSMDLEDTLPWEIRWITAHATSADYMLDLDTITLY